MNREEILNMSAGREMDALVLMELFGVMAFRDSNGQPYKIGAFQENEPVPNYSTDILAAWGIVEMMCKKHFRYEIGGNFMGLGQKYAAFDNEQFADKNPLYKAFADSTPHAICRAALLTTLED